MSEECKGCNSSGLYLLTCTACCLRLIESTPRGQHRAAMLEHLERSLTDDQKAALSSAWSSRSEPSAAATPASIGQCALDV